MLAQMPIHSNKLISFSNKLKSGIYNSPKVGQKP